MEYFDLIDEKGNKTGEKKLRSEVHRDGNWHRAVYVWIINSKGQLLITLRSPKKDVSPNLWTAAVGGHIEAGGNSLETAVRETEEELGLVLRPELFELLYSARMQQVFKGGSLLNNEITDSYLVNLDLNPSSIHLQEDEVADVKFIDWRELEGGIASNPERFVAHPDDYKKLFQFLHKRFD